MTAIRLSTGEVWEIHQERYWLDQELGNGLLHLRCERTGAPLQIIGTAGDLVVPTKDWLADQFAEGLARRLDRPSPNSPARSAALSFGGDRQLVLARDPSDQFRQDVLKALDRSGPFSLSSMSIRSTLASIWMSKPGLFGHRKPPSPTTVRRWLADRGSAGERPLRVMVNMAGKVPRRARLPLSVRRRMNEKAGAYWTSHKMSLGDAYDDLCEQLTGINSWLGRRSARWRAVPIPSKETFRKCVRTLECHETVATKFGKKAADTKFKPCGPGLSSRRPLVLGAMDHTQIDFHVVIDANGWKLLGRPWFTVILDVHTHAASWAGC